MVIFLVGSNSYLPHSSVLPVVIVLSILHCPTVAKSCWYEYNISLQFTAATGSDHGDGPCTAQYAVYYSSTQEEHRHNMEGIKHRMLASYSSALNTGLLNRHQMIIYYEDFSDEIIILHTKKIIAIMKTPPFTLRSFGNR